MTVNQCCEQLLEVEAKRGLGLEFVACLCSCSGICREESLAVGVARVGQEDQRIVYGTLEELRTVDFGAPLHSLVLIGETDEIEQEMLDTFRVTESTPRLVFAPATMEDST
jgi:diphthine synthase